MVVGQEIIRRNIKIQTLYDKCNYNQISVFRYGSSSPIISLTKLFIEGTLFLGSILFMFTI